MAKKMVLVLVFFILFAKPVNADSVGPSIPSAKLVQNRADRYINDDRVLTLYSFLGKYNSPLQQNSSDFVRTADRYNLDWRLVVAISGVESTFGHQIPNSSYNAWGWGIYGDNMIYFKSYAEAIETISKSLRENYLDKWGAQNVYQIGRFYAASPTWAQRVAYFMEKIDSREDLPITL